MTNHPDPAYTHSPSTSTERAAAAKIAPKIKGLKATIMTMLAAAGAHGVTPDEVVAATGKLETSIRPRFTDLWDEGKIMRSGAERMNRRGNAEPVWVLGTDPSPPTERRHRRSTEEPTVEPAPSPSVGPMCPGCALAGRSRPLPADKLEIARREHKTLECSVCLVRISFPEEKT